MRLRCVLLLLPFLFLTCLNMYAQQVVEYEYEVTVKPKFGDVDKLPAKPMFVSYVQNSNFSVAQRNAESLKRIMLEESGISEERFVEFAFDEAPEGKFTIRSLNGCGVILLTGTDYDAKVILIHHNDGHYHKQLFNLADDFSYYVTSVQVGPDKWKYIIELRDPTITPEDVIGKRKVLNRKGSTIETPDGVRFKINLQLPGGTHEEDTRIILFPTIIDCLTEDTVDYLLPATYEGEKYHKLQDKRKGFDYMAYDPLGGERQYTRYDVRYDTAKIVRVDTIPVKGPDGKLKYIYDKDGTPIDVEKIVKSDTIDSIFKVENVYRLNSVGYIKAIEDLPHDTLYEGREGERDIKHIIHIDSSFYYKKPISGRRYRCVTRYTMEDYHHIYYYDEDPGSCLAIDPFKFLQRTNDAEVMPLTTAFYERAKEEPLDFAEELGIQFEYNTANIKEDSAYQVSIATIEKDMRNISLSGKLFSPKVVAYASPDGRAETNRALAIRRGEAARRLIHVPNGRIDVTPVIDTWDETIHRLDSLGYKDVAQKVRDIVDNNRDNSLITRQVRNLPEYAEVVKPVLDSQCRITFTYKYIIQKEFTPLEAKERYEQDKHYTFQRGDYYKLFTILKDSAELDTLTEIAYNRIIVRERNYNAPISPYLLNRMAILKIKRMQPDTTMLKPLIDESDANFRINKEVTRGMRRVVYNRPEIVMNQALMFYMMQNTERAIWFLDQLEANNYSSPSLRRLKAFINFTLLYAIPDRTERQEADFQESLRLIENSGPNNRAVLYTEFEELNRRDLAWAEVHKMDDNLPLKWYLMAILWSTRDGQEGNYPLSRFKIDESEVKITGIPYYMAYFWKSFDLDRNYMKYYFNEGHISEEMRGQKMHAYKEERVPAYRKIFELRKKIDDKERAKILNDMAREKRRQSARANANPTPQDEQPAVQPATESAVENSEETN